MGRGVAGLGREGAADDFPGGQRSRAGGLARRFGKSHAFATFGDADIDPFADGGGAIDEDDQAADPGDAFGVGIPGGGFGDDDIHFGASDDVGGDITGAGSIGRARRLRRQIHLGQHRDEQAIGNSFPYTGNIDDGGLARAGAGDERDEAADLGNAGGAVFAFIVNEHLVAVPQAGHEAGGASGRIDDIAGIDGGGSFLAGHNDRDIGAVRRPADQQGDGHCQDDAQNGQKDQDNGAQGTGGGGGRVGMAHGCGS